MQKDSSSGYKRLDLNVQPEPLLCNPTADGFCWCRRVSRLPFEQTSRVKLCCTLARTVTTRLEKVSELLSRFDKTDLWETRENQNPLSWQLGDASHRWSKCQETKRPALQISAPAVSAVSLFGLFTQQDCGQRNQSCCFSPRCQTGINYSLQSVSVLCPSSQDEQEQRRRRRRKAVWSNNDVKWREKQHGMYLWQEQWRFKTLWDLILVGNC